MCFPAPCLITSLKGICIKEVSCGSLHTACITDTGQLYVWGCGDGSRLGLNDNNDRHQPTRHKAFKRHRVLKIACSKWHSLALVQADRSDSHLGHVYSWGSGQFGQLGLGKTLSSRRPRKVYTEAEPNGILARLISAGSHHNVLVSNDERLYSWGQQMGGCLGRHYETAEAITANPSRMIVFNPQLVKGFGPDVFGQGPIADVGAGAHFTIVLTRPKTSSMDGNASQMGGLLDNTSYTSFIKRQHDLQGRPFAQVNQTLARLSSDVCKIGTATTPPPASIAANTSTKSFSSEGTVTPRASLQGNQRLSSSESGSTPGSSKKSESKSAHLTHLTKHHLAKSHHMADLMQLQNKDLVALCAEHGLTNVHMAGTGRLIALLKLSDAMVDRKF